MENENKNNYKTNQRKDKSENVLALSILISSIIIAGAWLYKMDKQNPEFSPDSLSQEQTTVEKLAEEVIPSEGVIIPVVWGDMGARMVEAGVIDASKFKNLYSLDGKFDGEYEELLLGKNNGQIKITRKNAQYLLNLFWALGLSNQNPILESREEMNNPTYGGADNYASTAGWTISVGNPMEHYSRHTFFNLTAEQQRMVDKISAGIYRPCCDNSVHFPDCNHGMAMLGLLEMMASEGASEKEMWQTALAVNSYWFPDTYMTIGLYKSGQGVGWTDVDPKEVLGKSFSSASGYARVASEVQNPTQSSGGGCSV